MADAPISVSISEAHGAELTTYSDVKGADREALCLSFALSEKLGRTMYRIYGGNGTLLAESKSFGYRQQEITPRCHSEVLYSPYRFSPPIEYSEEVVGAIVCSDSRDQTNTKSPEFLEYWQRASNESVYLGDPWPQIACCVSFGE